MKNWDKVGRTAVYIFAIQKGKRLIAPIKIGISMDVRSRLSSVQVHHYLQVGFVASFECHKRENAIFAEQRMHLALGDRCIRGDWFQVSPSEATELMNEVHVLVEMREAHL